MVVLILYVMMLISSATETIIDKPSLCEVESDDLPDKFIIRMFACPQPRSECKDENLTEESSIKTAIREKLFPEIENHYDVYYQKINNQERSKIQIEEHKQALAKLRKVKKSFQSCYEFLSLDTPYGLAKSCHSTDLQKIPENDEEYNASVMDSILSGEKIKISQSLREICCESCDNFSIKEVTDFPMDEDSFPTDADVKVRFLSGSYWTSENNHYSYPGTENACGVIFDHSKVNIVGGYCADVESTTGFFAKKILGVSMEEVRLLRRDSTASEFQHSYAERVANYVKVLEMNNHGFVNEEFCSKYEELVDEDVDYDNPAHSKVKKVTRNKVIKFCNQKEKKVTRDALLEIIELKFEKCKNHGSHKHNEVIFAANSASPLGFFMHQKHLKTREECKLRVFQVLSMKDLFKERSGREVKALMCEDAPCLNLISADEKNCDKMFP